MSIQKLSYIAAAALAASVVLIPARAAQTRHNLSIEFPDSAETCAGVSVRADGEVARSAETFNFTKAEAAALEVNGARNGNIRAIGWNQPGYQVEACKIAVANDRGAAETLLKGITVTRGAGRISADAPASADDVRWMTIFIVHAPREAKVDLQTSNGPIGVRNIDGAVKARAANGPVSVRDCGGTVDAEASNGPINFAGSGGAVRLQTGNGPISISIPNETWNGSELTAQTRNGPLSANVPAAFKSGLRIETSRNAPLNCSIDACRGVRSGPAAGGVVEVNGAAKLKLSTGNGPVSVGPRDGVRHAVI